MAVTLIKQQLKYFSSRWKEFNQIYKKKLYNKMRQLSWNKNIQFFIFWKVNVIAFNSRKQTKHNKINTCMVKCWTWRTINTQVVCLDNCGATVMLGMCETSGEICVLFFWNLKYFPCDTIFLWSCFGFFFFQYQTVLFDWSFNMFKWHMS